ncbi:MAG: putative ABC exporter domain-containing protein [Thermoanaerobaculia bacterium]
MSAASPVSIFGFLARRSIANAIRLRLRRLKEPRYLIGLVFGIFYFVTMFLRPTRSGRGPHGIPAMPVEWTETLLLFGACAVAMLVLVSWLLRSGEQALKLSEAEVQALFPAPLSARSILHYALLRTQLALLFSSLIVTLVLRRNFSWSGLRMTVAFWVILSVLQFHFQALGFTKARWRERPAGQRRILFGLTFAIVLGLVALVGVGLSGALQVVWGAVRHGHLSRLPSLEGVEPAMASTPVGAATLWVLWPIRIVLRPLIVPDLQGFLLALLPALGVLLLHYTWLARTAIRYEEATIEHAGRRAEQRLRRQGKTVGTHRAGAARAKVPFPLGSSGRPELAIIWKNLLAFGRIRLSRVALGLTLTFLASLAGSYLAVRTAPGFAGGILFAAGLVAVAALLIGPTITFTLRNDLRGDLEHASLLRQWPISPVRLVAAELAGPWLISTGIVWGGLAIAMALTSGSASALAQRGLSQDSLDAIGIETWAKFGKLFPVSLGLALAVPAIVALTLIVQNGTVLAFPAWFPPGRHKQSAGLETAGMRLISMLAISLLLLVALIPAAVLVVPLVIFGWSTLGLWTVPIAGLLTAAPVAAEVAGGVFILARLLERFDPSLELNA